jgi:hypothetical protein
MVFRERRPARHRAPDGTHSVGPNVAEDEVTAAEITAEIGSFFDESFFDSVEPLPARAVTLEPGTTPNPSATPSPSATPNPGTPADEHGSAPAESLRLRLPTPYAEQLDELAVQRGVTAAALLTTWVMERLATEGRPSAPSPSEKTVPTPRVAPAQRTNPDVPAAEPAREPVPGEVPSGETTSGELRQPATATWDLGLPEDLASLLSPIDQLNPIGDLAPPSPTAVTPLFRGPPPAHASEEPPKGPRHRAPEPVINLHSRRKI